MARPIRLACHAVPHATKCTPARPRAQAGSIAIPTRSTSPSTSSTRAPIVSSIAPRGEHGLVERLAALASLVDQVRDDLGVGVALEDAALFLELVLQLAEVLDDAVADHRDRAGHVRMRIAFGGLAVGGPARVADA